MKAQSESRSTNFTVNRRRDLAAMEQHDTQMWQTYNNRWAPFLELY